MRKISREMGNLYVCSWNDARFSLSCRIVNTSSSTMYRQYCVSTLTSCICIIYSSEFWDPFLSYSEELELEKVGQEWRRIKDGGSFSSNPSWRKKMDEAGIGNWEPPAEQRNGKPLRESGTQAVKRFIGLSIENSIFEEVAADLRWDWEVEIQSYVL